jgi:hypothetical protein
VDEPEVVEAAEAEVWLAEGEAALVMGVACGVCRVVLLGSADGSDGEQVLLGAQTCLVAAMERRGASECVDGGPRGARGRCLNEVVQVAGYGAFGWRVRLGARDTILMERLSIGEQDA